VSSFHGGIRWWTHMSSGQLNIDGVSPIVAGVRRALHPIAVGAP
jgi:hypothetical protein